MDDDVPDDSPAAPSIERYKCVCGMATFEIHGAWIKCPMCQTQYLIPLERDAENYLRPASPTRFQHYRNLLNIGKRKVDPMKRFVIRLRDNMKNKP